MSLQRIERALLSVLQPMTGARSTGSALVLASGANVVLPSGAYAVPLIASVAGITQLDSSRMVKTTAAATVTAAGVVVPIRSVLGGVHTNLALGTVLRWNPPIAGLLPTATVTGASMVGGADVSGPGTARRIVVYEGVGQRPNADALWKANLGAFPAVVVAWESSTPGPKTGGAKQRMVERFRIYVVATRLDGDDERRDEGKAALEEARALLVDRAAVDGEGFSGPPVTLGAAGRLPSTQGAYIYWTDIDVTHVLTRRDTRVFSPWLTTRQQHTTTPTAEYPLQAAALARVDFLHDQDPETP